MREDRLAELRDLRKVNCQAFGVAFSFNMGHCLAFGVAFSVNVLDKKYQSDALSLLKYTIKMAF